jgi:hypothetical protein
VLTKPNFQEFEINRNGIMSSPNTLASHFTSGSSTTVSSMGPPDAFYLKMKGADLKERFRGVHPYLIDLAKDGLFM